MSLFVLSLAIQNPSWPTLLRLLIAQTLKSGAGIFNLLSIAYSNWPRLRYRLTLSGWTVLSETLDFRRTGISPIFSLLIPTCSLLWSITCLSSQARIYQRTLPYPCTSEEVQAIASVIRLAPFVFKRKNTWPVSCYAIFKGWLLLSQPPGCLCISTSFTT
jgi:hypothetical protein